MSDEKNSTTLENISINTVRCGNVVQGKLFLPYVYLEGSDQQGKDISLIAYKDTALQLNEVLVASEIRDSEGRLIVSSGFIQEGHYVKHDISKYGIKMNFGDAVKKVNEDKAIFNFKEASFAPEVQARIDAARKAWVAAVQSALIPEVDHDTVLSSGQDMTQAPQEEVSEVEPLERSPSALESEVPADPQQVDDVNEAPASETSDPVEEEDEQDVSFETQDVAHEERVEVSLNDEAKDEVSDTPTAEPEPAAKPAAKPGGRFARTRSAKAKRIEESAEKDVDDNHDASKDESAENKDVSEEASNEVDTTNKSEAEAAAEKTEESENAQTVAPAPAKAPRVTARRRGISRRPAVSAGPRP